MSSQIRQLLDLITNSVETLEKACVANGTNIPDLQTVFDPASEAFRSDPVAAEAASIISAATLHLNAVIAPPAMIAYNAIGGHWRSAALRLCLESHTTEILREAGPEGLHVNDIAAKTGVDAQKLARCLRFLATEHIYREIKPDVFTNNRVSSIMDTLKPSKDIIADPGHKFDNTTGFAAVAGHHLDEVFKASTYLWENEADPKTAGSQKPEEASFTRALGTKKPLFEFYAQPEESFRQRRFNVAMRGFSALQSDQVTLTAYDWQSLPENSLVVDVGGGIGSVSLVLARAFNNLNIIIQDLPQVIDDGAKIWNQELPEAVSTGRVKFEAHNFFEAQPRKNVSVFFMKSIMHDWSDEYCRKILKPLREAATPNTKLVLMDSLVPYACHDPRDDALFGATAKEAPAPLLANWGASNARSYISDMCMMVMFNSQERTVDHFDQLLKSSGWKITAVRRQAAVGAAFLSSIEAAPILS
ncbi:hypothetical protein AX15_007060 [Amanita polypyramis BW_CC]|nr:hypothetical protein AX15_007060 [Amanita polypyramis BW_CC]